MKQRRINLIYLFLTSLKHIGLVKINISIQYILDYGMYYLSKLVRINILKYHNHIGHLPFSTKRRDFSENVHIHQIKTQILALIQCILVESQTIQLKTKIFINQFICFEN